MNQDYQSDFRPNFERRIAAVWGVGALLSSVALPLAGLNLGASAVLASPLALMSAYQLVFARRQQKVIDRLEETDLSFISLKQLEDEMADGALFIGHGFDWTTACAQKLSDLYRNTELIDRLRANGKGATFLHGIGSQKSQPIRISDADTKGHTLIAGTTGSGKTRLYDLLISQCILRGEPVIVIDPKGDHELKNNMAAAYERLGLGHKFSFLHPGFAETSVAINPLATYQRESELASRIASILPSDGKGDVFQSYSQNALAAIFFGVLMSKRNPTIMDVQRALSHGFGPVLTAAVQGWAERHSMEMRAELDRRLQGKSDAVRAKEAAHYYREVTEGNLHLSSSEMNGLVSLFEHDKTHFSKMVASLVPVVGQLCSGPLEYLLSPDIEQRRVPPSGRIVSLSRVVSQGGGLYIGLDTLSDTIVGSSLGQLILADLTSLAGANYNFGRRTGQFINCFVDEASEVVSDKLIQLLNKGRGAGFRMFVATQTIADFEARTGSKAQAEMLIGNLNTTIMLRTINYDTQEALSNRLPEVPIQHVMKSATTSLGDSSGDGSFSVAHGERLESELLPIVQPQTFGDLSDLEFFVRSPSGRLLKGRLPILEAPDDPPSTPRSVRVMGKFIDAALPVVEKISLEPPMVVKREILPPEPPRPVRPPRYKLHFQLPPSWVRVLPTLTTDDISNSR